MPTQALAKQAQASQSARRRRRVAEGGGGERMSAGHRAQQWSGKAIWGQPCLSMLLLSTGPALFRAWLPSSEAIGQSPAWVHKSVDSSNDVQSSRAELHPTVVASARLSPRLVEEPPTWPVANGMSRV
jgi:hypothetical protein